MKSKSFLLIIIILIAVIVVAILLLKPKQIISVETDHQAWSERYFLTADTTRGALTIEINIDRPIAYPDAEILNKIKTQVYTQLFGVLSNQVEADSMLVAFVKELKSEYVNNNAEFVDKLSKDNRLVFDNSFILEGFALLNDKHIFSYGITREVDLGGNHPAKTRSYYNFNLVDGSQISEKDIFVEGYEKELTSIIRLKLIADSHVVDEIPEIDSFEDSEFIVEAIRPNGNFYLNDEAICYVFNPFEIAPIYYSADTEVVLPYSLIKHLMKENNPISYLVTIPVEEQINR